MNEWTYFVNEGSNHQRINLYKHFYYQTQNQGVWYICGPIMGSHADIVSSHHLIYYFHAMSSGLPNAG